MNLRKLRHSNNKFRFWQPNMVDGNDVVIRVVKPRAVSSINCTIKINHNNYLLSEEK